MEDAPMSVCERCLYYNREADTCLKFRRRPPRYLTFCSEFVDKKEALRSGLGHRKATKLGMRGPGPISQSSLTSHRLTKLG